MQSLAARTYFLLVGTFLLSTFVLSAPHQGEAVAKKSLETSMKRHVSNTNQMGLQSQEYREDTRNKRAPRKPFILWGRDVPAKDAFKDDDKDTAWQPGMWGKRAMVRPKLNLLWGRALKERDPKLGLWGREKSKMGNDPQAGLWGRTSEPGKVGLWGRQLDQQHGGPDKDGDAVDWLWGRGKENTRSAEVKEELTNTQDLERELENKIIDLFRQLKMTEQKREFLEERKPKGAIGIWG